MNVVAKVQLFIIQTITGLHTLGKDERGDNPTIGNTAWAVAGAILALTAVGALTIYVNNQLNALP